MDVPNFLENLNKSVGQDRLWRRAKGRKLVICTKCKGSGKETEGYTDYDGSGSFWVSGTDCRYCRMGSVEIRCSKEEKISALEELLRQAKEEK